MIQLHVAFDERKGLTVSYSLDRVLQNAGRMPDPTRSDDISQVWAFRGPHTAIDADCTQTAGSRNMSLSLIDAEVPSDSLGLWWLGQAGFVFKTPAGKIVYLDPYLSDAVERLFGFKRLSLPPIAAEEVRADLVVLTHEHADHLDPGRGADHRARTIRRAVSRRRQGARTDWPRRACKPTLAWCWSRIGDMISTES